MFGIVELFSLTLTDYRFSFKDPEIKQADVATDTGQCHGGSPDSMPIATSAGRFESGVLTIHKVVDSEFPEDELLVWRASIG